MTTIRRLEPSDAAAYLELRREALLDTPLAFAASAGDDFVSTEEAIRDYLGRGVLFGAFDDRLTGSAGLFRDRHLKAAHKLHLWGMYVTPSHRGKGVGRALLEAAIAHATGMTGIAWIHLGVSSDAPAAQRLYTRAGFRVWGLEPDALRHAGRTVSEYRMAAAIFQRSDAFPDPS